MDVMFDRVAGLDVGKATVTVCVRTPGERGGRGSEGTRHGNKWLTSMLVEAAHSVRRRAALFARIASRRGPKRAAVAVAPSKLVSAYHTLLRDEPYADLGPDWLNRRNEATQTRRLVAQLERLGHTVTLGPAA